MALSNCTIKMVDEATYLGVSITVEGVSDGKNCKHTERAIKLANSERQLTKIPFKACRTIATVYVYPFITYRLHLAPLTITQQRPTLKLDEIILPWVLGAGKKASQ